MEAVVVIPKLSIRSTNLDAAKALLVSSPSQSILSINDGVTWLACTKEFFENGLVARLLLAYPPRRPKVWTEQEVARPWSGRFRTCSTGCS